MASFLVLAPQHGNGQRKEEGTVFIRDAFAFLAFILPFIWLLFHRLWFEAALVFLAAAAISVVGNYSGQDGIAALIGLLLSLLVALEANNWRAAALRRRGYEEIGIVDADNAADAETAWFHQQPSRSVTAPAPTQPASPAAQAPITARPAPSGGMLGLVSHRGEG